jgi:hypothetical protein
MAAKSLGTELFTLSKDQFNLYFDTIFRLRKEARIELRPDNGCVYTRFKDVENVIISEMILRVVPKVEIIFELSIESMLKLSPKKDVTFYDKDNQVILSNGDFVLKVTKIDPRVSGLGKVKPFPNHLAHVAHMYIDKPVIEKWNEFFKVATGDIGVFFKVTDNQLTVSGKIDDNVFEMHEPVAVEGSNCSVKISTDYLTKTFAHWKIYDTAAIHIGQDIPMVLELGSDLLTIKSGIAPFIGDN